MIIKLLYSLPYYAFLYFNSFGCYHLSCLQWQVISYYSSLLADNVLFYIVLPKQVVIFYLCYELSCHVEMLKQYIFHVYITNSATSVLNDICYTASQSSKYNFNIYFSDLQRSCYSCCGDLPPAVSMVGSRDMVVGCQVTVFSWSVTVNISVLDIMLFSVLHKTNKHIPYIKARGSACANCCHNFLLKYLAIPQRRVIIKYTEFNIGKCTQWLLIHLENLPVD